MFAPRVKICCISSVEESRIAIAAGASALGFVSKMPSGPGVIEEELIAEIVAQVPAPIATFLLTSSQDADFIFEQHARCKTNTIQLVDEIASIELRKLRARLGGIDLVQVIHVTDAKSVASALNVAPFVDALLLDSGNPNLEVKELGGTGRMHDWNLSREICVRSPAPVYLAGGLNPDNVREAITNVKPFGLDICSGVRTNGKLDEAKLTKFFAAVHSASNK